VNGPEILNKYVGQAEENIRNLFADAEKEYKQEGENSQLHVVIFDEIDSICKSRGSKADSTGVHDSIVNQLLSKIDGVDALNNILLIGMTNRKDLIDEALLRPGRLEVHVEISLPDEAGRIHILNIHTKAMREKSYLDMSVSIPAIAAGTKNFSGAEISGLIRSATSFALNRKVHFGSIAAPSKDLGNITVTNEDFEQAMLEIKPLFGQHEDEFEMCARFGIMHFSADFEHMLNSCKSLIEQVRSSENTPLLTCLLNGSPGCGKSALAAHLAQGSDFPFIRRIGPEGFVGYTDQGKVSAITKIFEDAYKSPLSVIVLDDVERLVDYVPIGPRFSSFVLSAIFALLKKSPPKAGRRLLIIATTSAKEFLQETEMLRAFNVALNVPLLTSPDHFKFVLERRPGFTAPVVAEICGELGLAAVGIRTLLLVAEMAFQRQDPVSKPVFMECLRIAGDA
jgi:vesicle-fusing ATPase